MFSTFVQFTSDSKRTKNTKAYLKTWVDTSKLKQIISWHTELLTKEEVGQAVIKDCQIMTEISHKIHPMLEHFQELEFSLALQIYEMIFSID